MHTMIKFNFYIRDRRRLTNNNNKVKNVKAFKRVSGRRPAGVVVVL